MASKTFALVFALLAGQAARADITIRYQFDIKPGAAIPAQVRDLVQGQLNAISPNGIESRAKGQRCSSAFGPLSSIIDGESKQVTLLNPTTRQFATVPIPDYAAGLTNQIPIPELPPQAADFFKSLNIKAEASKTGQTATIQGIQADDNLLTISLDLPGTPGPPVTVRLEVHDWLPAAGEMDRVPALRELMGCSSSASPNIDPREMLDKVLAMLPGMQEKLGDALKFFVDRKNGPAMKVHLAIYVPAAAMLLPPPPGQPPIDPSAPLLELDMNMAEFSPAPIPDSAFTVPADYMAAPLDELIKSFQSSFGQPAPPAKPATPGGRAQARPPVAVDPPKTEVNLTLPSNRNDGITNPVPVFQNSPQYTEEARRAKLQGTVLLSLVVDKDGHTQNPKVVRSLDPGLDQEAIKAVSTWTFRPGMKDGRPVAMAAQVQVLFRLLDDPAKAADKQ